MSLPVHWREAAKKTAELHNLSEKQVKEIVLWYWRYYRSQMRTMQMTKVVLPGFGTFYLKYWKFERKIEEIKRKKKALGNYKHSLKKWLRFKKYQEDFRVVKAAQKVMVEEFRRKARIKKKQVKMQAQYYPVYFAKLKERSTNEEIIKSLEKQMADLGGDKKLLDSQAICGEDRREAGSDLPFQ